jgi:hypothetical protein
VLNQGQQGTRAQAAAAPRLIERERRVMMVSFIDGDLLLSSLRVV